MEDGHETFLDSNKKLWNMTKIKQMGKLIHRLQLARVLSDPLLVASHI